MFIVFDEVFTDQKYEQFIEFKLIMLVPAVMALSIRPKVHRDHAIAMIKGTADTQYTVIGPNPIFKKK